MRFRRLLLGCVGGVCALAVAGCSTTSRPFTYYTLAPSGAGAANGVRGAGAERVADPSPAADPAADPAPAAAPTPPPLPRVAVERLRAPEIYQDGRMAWRSGAQIEHFRFLRWAGPPAEMLRDEIIDEMERSGRFESVDRFESGRSSAPCLLEGELQELCFEGGAAAGEWQVRLTFGLRLVRIAEADGRPVAGGEVLARWRPTLCAEVAAPKGEGDLPSTVAKLAAALGEKLRAERLGRQIAERLASK